MSENYTEENKSSDQKEETQQNESPIATEDTKNKTPWILAVILLVAVGAGVYYFQQSDKDDVGPIDDVSIFQSENPEEVLAVVNDEEITQAMVDERLRGASQQLLAQGIDITDASVRAGISSQILEDIIDFTVMKQSAISSGVTPSEQDLLTTLDGYKAQTAGEEDFVNQLQQIGLTMDEFTDRLRTQLVIDEYLKENIDLESIVITEEAMQEMYDNASQAGAQGLPAFEDIKDQIQQQLRQQEEQKLILAFTDTLRESATIEIK